MYIKTMIGRLAKNRNVVIAAHNTRHDINVIHENAIISREVFENTILKKNIHHLIVR